jgi:phospholysine phosphohistidine inorganic pyrophosphate phosphatase
VTKIRGLLVDLDGTVYEGDRPVPGASEAIAALRDAGVPFLFTTNTSRMSRADVVASLAGMGLETREAEILTAPVAAAAWLRSEGLTRLHPLLADSTYADFAGFELTESEAEAVLVGDLGEGFTFPRLNAAFRSLRGGARLVAIHRNRYWIPAQGPTLDAGPFVAALEYAADVRATLVGKPSPEFFRAAARRLELPVESLAVVGDDPESDIRGGRRAGLVTFQVRTGKFDPDRLARAPEEERPHHVVDALGDVPALLG